MSIKLDYLTLSYCWFGDGAAVLNKISAHFITKLNFHSSKLLVLSQNSRKKTSLQCSQEAARASESAETPSYLTREADPSSARCQQGKEFSPPLHIQPIEGELERVSLGSVNLLVITIKPQV